MLGSTDRPQDADLFSPFKNRDIGDNANHNRRNDQRDTDKRNQDVRNRIDNGGDAAHQQAHHIGILNRILFPAVRTAAVVIGVNQCGQLFLVGERLGNQLNRGRRIEISRAKRRQVAVVGVGGRSCVALHHRPDLIGRHRRQVGQLLFRQGRRVNTHLFQHHKPFGSFVFLRLLGLCSLGDLHPFAFRHRRRVHPHRLSQRRECNLLLIGQHT